MTKVHRDPENCFHCLASEAEECIETSQCFMPDVPLRALLRMKEVLSRDAVCKSEYGKMSFTLRRAKEVLAAFWDNEDEQLEWLRDEPGMITDGILRDVESVRELTGRLQKMHSERFV